MKQPFVQGTETMGFTTREARDAEWSRMRGDGVKGVTRSTSQIENRMVYVLSWPRTAADIVTETVAEAEAVLAQNEPKAPLTSEPGSDTMVGEGGNPNDEQQIS